MEINKWYEGTVLPTEECDCVVVYESGSNRQTNLAHVSFYKSGQIVIKIELFGVLNPYAVKAWMPIKVPAEEELWGTS